MAGGEWTPQIRMQALALAAAQEPDDYFVGAASSALCGGVGAPLCGTAGTHIWSNTFGPGVDRGIADAYFNTFHKGKFPGYTQLRDQQIRENMDERARRECKTSWTGNSAC